MRFLSFPIVFILLFLTPVFAAEPEELSPEDQQELDRLMGVLDKHTEIATFTKMNADYIPGMVTVLEGRDLEARGKRNVMEALTLVPGLDISLSQGGTPSMTSRGIGAPYLPATSLIMLDGVSMNSTSSGTASITFGIPIEQIERIEVIRGPGTSVNGEFAYNSVINIITRQDGNSIHGSYGRYRTYSGGGMATYDNPEDRIKLSVNMATSNTDGADHNYGPDNFGNSGKANEDREMDSLFAVFKYHDFSLTTSYIDAGQGSFFEPFPNKDDEITSTQAVLSIEAQQLIQPRSDLDILFKIGWQENESDIEEARVAPPGFILYWPDPLNPIPYSDGIQIGYYSKEEKILSGIESTWKVTPDNTLTLALNYNYTSLKETDTYGNFDPDTWQPSPWQKYDDANNFLDSDTTRNHFAAALQDQYHLTDTLSIMAGLRWDHYSDVEDDQITPRISGVWQPSEHHIFKLQYAKAFRPPTFMELTGNANFVQGNDQINSEIIDTFEVGYIFRTSSIIAKLTLFYSDLDDLISIQTTSAGLQYSNDAAATQTGFEIEYKQDILENLEFDGNISYAKTDDDDSHDEVANGRNWLINLGLTYSPCEWSSINTQYRFVDERYRSYTDPRDNLKGYDVIDVTLSFYPQMVPGLTIRTGLKNVFDDGAYVSSTETSLFFPKQGADYPVLDRFWWGQVTYDF